jgi:hypothetical protein
VPVEDILLGSCFVSIITAVAMIHDIVLLFCKVISDFLHEYCQSKISLSLPCCLTSELNGIHLACYPYILLTVIHVANAVMSLFMENDLARNP